MHVLLLDSACAAKVFLAVKLTWFPSALDQVPFLILLSAESQENYYARQFLFEKFISMKCKVFRSNLFDQSFRAPDKSTLQNIQHELYFYLQE